MVRKREKIKIIKEVSKMSDTKTQIRNKKEKKVFSKSEKAKNEE